MRDLQDEFNNRVAQLASQVTLQTDSNQQMASSYQAMSEQSPSQEFQNSDLQPSQEFESMERPMLVEDQSTSIAQNRLH